MKFPVHLVPLCANMSGKKVPLCVNNGKIESAFMCKGNAFPNETVLCYDIIIEMGMKILRFKREFEV